MLAAYGVLIGDFVGSGEHQGQWLHAILNLNVNGVPHECAVDVNEPTLGFQYRIFDKMDASLFQIISMLPDGYHPLDRSPHSGAMDYARNPVLTTKLYFPKARPGLVPRPRLVERRRRDRTVEQDVAVDADDQHRRTPARPILKQGAHGGLAALLQLRRDPRHGEVREPPGRHLREAGDARFAVEVNHDADADADHHHGQPETQEDLPEQPPQVLTS